MKMNQEERALVFESAMEDLDAGLHGLAARTLRHLVEDGTEEPAHLSYCGLLEAMTDAPSAEAIDLCRRAVASARVTSPDLFLNLARVLLLAERRREAIETLSRGVSAHPEDKALLTELQHLVPRAQPVFGTFPRRHPLNKYAGIARTVGRRLWVTFVPRVRRVSPPKKPSRDATHPAS